MTNTLFSFTRKEHGLKLESDFQSRLKLEIRTLFPGSIVLKTDPNDIQGFPDLLVLWYERWAALEVKRKSNSAVRPNQKYYIDQLNKMSFASFISPSTEEVVLNELQRSFRP